MENSTPPSLRGDRPQIPAADGGRDVLAILGHTAAEEADFAITMLAIEAEDNDTAAAFQNVLSKMYVMNVLW